MLYPWLRRSRSPRFFDGGPEPLAAESRRRNLGVDLIKSWETDDFRELCIEALDARIHYRSGLLMERQLDSLAVRPIGRIVWPRTIFRTAVLRPVAEPLRFTSSLPERGVRPTLFLTVVSSPRLEITLATALDKILVPR